MLVPCLCPWVQRWVAAFDVNAENVFHQCRPSSCLENIFHRFNCLLSNSMLATQKVCWNPYECCASVETSPWLVFRFNDNLAFHHNLELFQLAAGLWPAKVICHICIFFDSALWLLHFRKIFCNLQPGKLEIGFQRSGGVTEFLATFIKVRKIRVLRQAIIAFAGGVIEEYVFHIHVFTFAFLEAVAVLSLQLFFNCHKPCLSKDVNF